jgi:hypothetical protein
MRLLSVGSAAPQIKDELAEFKMKTMVRSGSLTKAEDLKKV